MATNKPAAKKTTAKVSKPATAKVVRKNNPAEILYKEKHPECHKVTGKFVFFYFLFAGTTILFAFLSVYLFIFATDTQNKYQSIKACTRAHTSCKVTYDGSNYSAEGNAE